MALSLFPEESMQHQMISASVMAAIIFAIIVCSASADIRQSTSAYLDTYRKGGFVLTVRGPDGKPLQGATIAVEQTRHDYRFGAAIDYRITSSGYWDAAKKYFNMCVEENAMKWRKIDEFDKGLAALDRLRAAGLQARGHSVFWGRDNCDLQGTDVPRSVLQAHCRDVVGRAKGHVVEWDLDNEILTNGGQIACNYIKKYGEGLWKEMANWAWGVDPSIKLCFNEFGCEGEKPKAPHYAAFVKRVLATGIPKEKVMIGLQSHMSQISSRGENLSPEYLNNCLNTMATLGIPLQATELDFDVTSDAELASKLELFMRVWFAHPATVGIIQWSFWGPGGFSPARRTWGERSGNNFTATGASASVYKKLVFDEWWTRASAVTDAAGSCSLGVFYGTHTIKVSYQGKSATWTLSYPNPMNGLPKLSGGSSDLVATMVRSPATVWKPSTAIERVEISTEGPSVQRARLVNVHSGANIMTASTSFDLRGRIIAGTPGRATSTPIIIHQPGRFRH